MVRRIAMRTSPKRSKVSVAKKASPKRPKGDKKSDYKCVYWLPDRQRFTVIVGAKTIGYYVDEIDAAKAVAKAKGVSLGDLRKTAAERRTPKWTRPTRRHKYVYWMHDRNLWRVQVGDQEGGEFEPKKLDEAVRTAARIAKVTPASLKLPKEQIVGTGRGAQGIVATALLA